MDPDGRHRAASTLVALMLEAIRTLIDWILSGLVAGQAALLAWTTLRSRFANVQG